MTSPLIGTTAQAGFFGESGITLVPFSLWE